MNVSYNSVLEVIDINGFDSNVEKRFVDNGAIITTAGVSAGIDETLHMVFKLRGLEKRTSWPILRI